MTLTLALATTIFSIGLLCGMVLSVVLLTVEW